MRHLGRSASAEASMNQEVRFARNLSELITGQPPPAPKMPQVQHERAFMPSVPSPFKADNGELRSASVTKKGVGVIGLADIQSEARVSAFFNPLRFNSPEHVFIGKCREDSRMI